jgi:hypothetical protein
MMEGDDERSPTTGGVLMDFVENALRLPHLSVKLHSFSSIKT